MYLETFEEQEKKITESINYVVTFMNSKDNTTDCIGIYKDYYEALGHAMNFIFEFVEGMDTYSIKAPASLGEDVGESIEFRDSEWNRCTVYIYFHKQV